MWQRTQIIVNRKVDGKALESFALHNQWWFWRPTVTGAIAIVKYVKEHARSSFDLEQRNIHANACRPMWYDEYFNRHEPYKCSNTYQAMEHDNNDGRAIVDIEVETGSDEPNKYITVKKADVSIYNGDWVEMWALEYIYHCNAIVYCDDTWLRRFNFNKHLLD